MAGPCGKHSRLSGPVASPTFRRCYAVPGHGEVEQGKGQLELPLSYRRDTVAAIKDAVGKGMTLDLAKQAIDFSKYLSMSGYAAGNPLAIERAYDEITGMPME